MIIGFTFPLPRIFNYICQHTPREFPYKEDQGQRADRKGAVEVCLERGETLY